MLHAATAPRSWWPDTTSPGRLSDAWTPPPQRLPASIWALGFVSLLMDISSELIHSLRPVFLVTVLGTSMLTVGLIEGVAEATALIVKVFSGALSDWWGRRKPLAVLGYSLGTLTKPFFALATSTEPVIAARLLDRIGKGIRGAPRDALVADIAPPALRGAAFGMFNLISGLAMLLASVLAGPLWDQLGASFTFAAGAGFSMLAALFCYKNSSPVDPSAMDCLHFLYQTASFARFLEFSCR